MDYNNILFKINNSLEMLKKQGEVASYIPELSKVK